MPVIQFICFSSVEAYLPWKCCCVMLHYEFLEPWIAWDVFPTLIFVTGNLCNKCPSGYLNKRAVLVILSMWSLVSIEQQSIRRPCDILVANVGPEVAKTAKTVILFINCKNVTFFQKCVQSQKWPKWPKTALSEVSQQELCSGEFWPTRVFHQAQEPCPAFPSLLQLIPARLGPRSLAQLPRSSVRVPIIQGASQRVNKAQESLSVPRWSPGHVLLQPIGTVPRTWFSVHMCFYTSKLNIYFILFATRL